MLELSTEGEDLSNIILKDCYFFSTLDVCDSILESGHSSLQSLVFRSLVTDLGNARFASVLDRNLPRNLRSSSHPAVPDNVFVCGGAVSR